MDVQEIIKQITEFITNYAWNVLGSLLIFIVGKWLAKKIGFPAW